MWGSRHVAGCVLGCIEPAQSCPPTPLPLPCPSRRAPLSLQMTADLTGAQASSMALGASWQANKNVMVKGRLGLDGAAAAVVFRSWWQPAFEGSAAVHYDFITRSPRYGFWLAVETYKSLRWVVGGWAGGAGGGGG